MWKNEPVPRYSVWLNKTDDLVCADMTAEECCNAMHLSRKSFFSARCKCKKGIQHKWTILSEKELEDTMSRSNENITKTPEGYKIYQCWYRIRHKYDLCPAWESFGPFYKWAIKNHGGESGMAFFVKDPSKQCGPDNCVFCERDHARKENSENSAYIRKWNTTVNRIRKHYGMSPIGDEHDHSGLLED